MNIKDKLTICLIIISVIVLSIVLKSNAGSFNYGEENEINNDKDLAVLAQKVKNNEGTFINETPKSNWFTTELGVHVGKEGNPATISYSSAACMFHEESYKNGSVYNITNVININWDEEKNDYHAYGWWPDSSSEGGVAHGELTSINSDYTKLVNLDIFLQAMYNAYISNKTFYTTTEKSAMKTCFYKGIQDGGFLTVDDGIGLNINPEFMGETACESLDYHDESSRYNVRDLLSDYAANTKTGVGLTINGENTCTKEKDTDGDNTIFGPFNIYFFRPIYSISIVGEANSWDTNKDGNNIYYSYDKVNWFNDYTNIEKNTNFYIKISDGEQKFYSQSSNITITFNQESIITYKARFILLKSGATNGQNLMIYAAQENDLYTASAQYTVKGNTLRVVKYGLSENESIETAEKNEVAKQAGVGFIINNGSKYLKYNNENQEVKIGKMNYNNTDFSWIEDRNSATIFETVNTDDGWKGYFQISNMPSGKYYIGEIYNKNSGYEDSFITAYKLEYEGEPSKEYIYGEDVQIGDNISGYTKHNIQVINVELAADGYTKVLRVYDSLLSDFNITLNKVDKSGDKIGGALFKIKVLDKDDSVKGWLKKTSTGGYMYVAKYKEASIWSSSTTGTGKYEFASTKGIISISKLEKDYKYQIYEFKPGDNCYALDKQIENGMKVTINDTSIEIKHNKATTSTNEYIATDENIYCGITSYGLHKSKSVINITNISEDDDDDDDDDDIIIKQKVNVSGVVWLDRTGNKDDGNNGVYDYDSSKGINEGIQGVTVQLINDNGICEEKVTTDVTGKYSFSKKIKKSNLSNYYVKILYNKIGDVYSIIGFGTGDNESKAIEQGTGWAKTIAVNSKYYEHMNVGLTQTGSTSEEFVQKWVDNVEVVMKGENNKESKYTYKYGEDNSDVGGGASVAVKNTTLYASDIIYSKKSEFTKGLEVYITYKIKAKNNTTTYQEDGDGNIREKYMDVTVTDVYDKNYYELSDENWTKSSKQGEVTYTEFKLYNKNNPDYKEDTYKDEKTISIKFKLTSTAMGEILNKGIITTSNKVVISGKHNYEKCEAGDQYYTYNKKGNLVLMTEYNWKGETKGYEKVAYAPGMTFSIYEKDGETVAQRTISGTVFEDKNINSTGEILGNGYYDDSASSKENTVQSVKVELMYQNSNKINGGAKSPATIYNYSEEIDENDNIVKKEDAMPAETYTSQDGTYTFEGIIPGDYYIRFTYGNRDGSQKIIEVSPSGSKDANAYDYKSTTIENSSLAGMIKKDRKSQEYNYYWYRDTNILTGYSTAVDVLSDRENFNNQSSKIYNIRAYTPTLKIEIENTEKDTVEFKDLGNLPKYEIKNMNFGIIEIPKIKLGFEKVITNIRITNTSGQIIIDGNPRKTIVKNKYLSDLDAESHIVDGSVYAKIEINNEELYGAKLEITYALTIINNSDVNYYEKKDSDYYGYYYMFGEIHNDGGDKNKTHEVNITIDEVLDYLDEKLEVIGNDHKISDKIYSSERYTLYLDGNDWKKIYTGIVDRTDSKPTQDIAKIIATRTLSNQDINIDTTFENTAQVKRIHITDYPELIENVNVHYTANATLKYSNYFTCTVNEIKLEEISKKNLLTIIPPTGSDKITLIIYIITTVISGIIITIGIIVIKKKVLNK